jgi:hypothetical protein
MATFWGVVVWQNFTDVSEVPAASIVRAMRIEASDDETTVTYETSLDELIPAYTPP